MSELLPLESLRVLDLSAGTGAAATSVRLLVQLGASVRRLDARSAPGEARALAARADVTVSDLRSTEASRLGLDARALGGPDGVVVSITPFGLDGPDTDRSEADAACAGMDPLVAAALTGAHAAAAGLAALRWARCHGRGALVEVASIEVVAACFGDLLPRATCPRGPVDPSAGARANGALAVLPCADGYVGLAVSSAVDRDLLAGLTGLEAVRAPHVDLARALGQWLGARTRSEVFHAAQLWRLPMVPVLAPDEVYGDAQCVARGVWARQEGQPVARSPFRFRSTARGEVPTDEADRRPGTRAGWGCSGQAAGDERPPYLTADGMHTPRVPHDGRAFAVHGYRAPLVDLMVLDLGMVWAGPYCGRLLAGLGARVVKIEGPARRDGTRPKGQDGCAGAFGDLNRGKESLVLGLANAAGREAFLRLATRADVVLENFSPRVMPNFGLDYAALARANPRLLMLSLPAFGASGPWSDYVAYGSGLELATGLAAIVDGRPVPAPVAYLDYLAGTYGAVGVLASLLARDRSGRGACLELAQREVGCQVLANSLLTGQPPGPWLLDALALRAHPQLAARGLFAVPPADGPCHHYARLPWRLHGSAAYTGQPAPAFGADSRRVLRDLAGLGPGEIEGLVAAGVVVASKAEGAPAEPRGERRALGLQGATFQGFPLPLREGSQPVSPRD